MRVKKLMVIFITIIIAILIGTTKVEATLRLKELDFNVSLNDDGSMDVIETWNISISETNTLYKTFNIDKNKYDSITNFSVKEITSGRTKFFTNSYKWAYHLPRDYYFGGLNEDGQYEVAWGVDLENSSATRKYEISYTVLDAVHKFGDCAELYWQFLGDKFEIPADKITGIIKLPYSMAEKEDIRVWGHSEDLNGEIYVKDSNTVKLELSKYKSKHFVEVRIAVPTYVFENLNYTSYEDRLDDIIKEEKQWTEEANERRRKKEIFSNVLVGAQIGIFGLLALIFIRKTPKYLTKLKNTKKLIPNAKPEYYRDLPDETATPAEAMFLLTKYIDTSKALSATLLNLALKKYIEFTQKEKNVYITILNDDLNNLRDDEQEVLKLIKKVRDKVNENQFSMKELEKYVKKHPTSISAIEKEFPESAKKYAEEKDKFKEEIEQKGTSFSVMAFLYIFFMSIFTFFGMVAITLSSAFFNINTKLITILIPIFIICMVSMLINGILTWKLAGRHKGFTQKGVDEQEEWKAFKKYMLDFSLLNEKEVPHLVLWERYLVFATAFGIAEKVIKQLKIKYPELSNPDTTSNMIILSTLYSGGNFNTNFISSINSSTSNMYSSYSSATGGGRWILWRWWRPVAGGGRRRWTIVYKK